MEVPGGEPRGRRRQPGRGQRPSPRASTCIFAAGEERLTLFTLSDRRHAPRPRPRHRGRSWRGPRPPLPTCCPDLPGLRARVTGLQCRVCLSATDFKGRCQNKGEFGINNTAARTPEVRARGEQCPARAPVRPEDAGAGDAAGPALRGGRREAPSPGGGSRPPDAIYADGFQLGRRGTCPSLGGWHRLETSSVSATWAWWRLCPLTNGQEPGVALTPSCARRASYHAGCARSQDHPPRRTPRLRGPDLRHWPRTLSARDSQHLKSRCLARCPCAVYDLSLTLFSSKCCLNKHGLRVSPPDPIPKLLALPPASGFPGN